MQPPLLAPVWPGQRSPKPHLHPARALAALQPPLRIWHMHWRKRTRVHGASLGPAYAHAGFVPLHCPRANPAKGYRSESPLRSVREVLQALPVPSATHPRYVLDAVCGVPYTASGTVAVVKSWSQAKLEVHKMLYNFLVHLLRVYILQIILYNSHIKRAATLCLVSLMLK